MLLNKILTSVSDTYDYNGKKSVIFLNTGDIYNGKFLHNDYIDVDILPGQAKKSIKYNDLLYSEIRPINKHFALVPYKDCEDYVVSTKLMVLRLINKNYLMNYIYQYLSSPRILDDLQTIAESRSGTFPQITFSELGNVNIPDISLSEQQHIVNILESIDEKIENNEQILLKIDQMATLLYKKECNKDCTVVELGDYVTNYDKQRKPLSSRERERLAKIYPYYGATEILDYVDAYLFDGDFVLLGEDGTVIDAKGYPIIQRVNERFWANNHTHILQGINGIDNNILEIILKNTNVKSIVTGAVQPKINQANMNSLKIILPTNLEHLALILKPLFSKKFKLLEINKKLNKQKQLYLKKFFG